MTSPEGHRTSLWLIEILHPDLLVQRSLQFLLSHSVLTYPECPHCANRPHRTKSPRAAAMGAAVLTQMTVSLGPSSLHC